MDGSGDGWGSGSEDDTWDDTWDDTCVVVDTGVVDEAVQRVGRARDGLTGAAEGLDRLPVAGVALGADALLDSLCDLGRQWQARLDDAAEDAGRLVAALSTAAVEYARTERAAATAACSPLQRTLDRAFGVDP